MLPSDHDGVIITGKRKKGKSTLLAQLLHNEKRVMLYDAKGELREPHKIYTGEIPTLPYRGVYRGYVARGNRPAEEVEWTAYLAMLLRRCILVIDELPDALEDREPGEAFKWVTRMGRMRDVRFVYSFQRAPEVPPMVRTNSSDWYLGQTNEDTDLQWIKKCVSGEAMKHVRSLTVGQFLHVKDGNVVAVMETIKP